MGDLLSEFCYNDGTLVMAHLLPALYVWCVSLTFAPLLCYLVAKVRIHDFH